MFQLIGIEVDKSGEIIPQMLIKEAERDCDMSDAFTNTGVSRNGGEAVQGRWLESYGDRGYQQMRSHVSETTTGQSKVE